MTESRRGEESGGRGMMRSHTQEAGAGQLVIDGHPCSGCGMWFHLANYDNRVIVGHDVFHPECMEEADSGKDTEAEEV